MSTESPTAPLNAQDVTRRLLALIGDIHSMKDISAELVQKHFGRLGGIRATTTASAAS